ncbi:MAG: peptide chain release factor 2 [Oscillospiraceae bacterium]
MLDFEQLRLDVIAIKPSIEDLADAIGYNRLKKQLSDLEKDTEQTGFWNNLELSKNVNRQMSKIKDKIKAFDDLMRLYEDTLALIEIAIEENDESLYPEAYENYKKCLSMIEIQRLSTLLTGEYDSKNAILTFHAGAGGTEAQDWVSMLLRMYTMWADKHSYQHKILDYLDGEEAGLKSVTMLIEGVNIYGYLRSESGVHRLIRISPFDSSGRRHTSFASLEVMPEIDDDIDITINEADLRVDTYRSGGAGGQHVNKTESAIRLTHLPTGVVVACQNERSQHMNREVAMKMLKSKLIEIKEREHLEKIEDIKGDQKDIGWGNQIRTYTFMPYTLAKDHRTNYEIGNIGTVMDGEIDEFINAYLKLSSSEE